MTYPAGGGGAAKKPPCNATNGYLRIPGPFAPPQEGRAWSEKPEKMRRARGLYLVPRVGQIDCRLRSRRKAGMTLHPRIVDRLPAVKPEEGGGSVTSTRSRASTVHSRPSDARVTA